MHPLTLLLIIGLYFLLLLGIGYAGKKHNNNASFYLGGKQSPWYVVAFGMLGASLSGITFVSVPGMVMQSGYTYMQLVVGFSLGYLLVAHVLLPLYYKLQVTSIYQYLGQRFGTTSQKTGSFYFLLSRTLGAGIRLYAAALILGHMVFQPLGVPFPLTIAIWMGIIYLYTSQAGIRTIVWTDALQTLCILVALCLLLWESSSQLEAFPWQSYPYAQWDWVPKNNFFKWVISGMFITLTMTGLDQDMMQKNLSCKTLRDAQKNMYCYGFSFIPVNLAFLFLGACLVVLLHQNSIALPTASDQLVTTAIESGFFSPLAILLFTLGIVAATCSSSDSALISITTAINIDFLPPSDAKTSEKRRKITHACVCLGFILLLWGFYYIGNQNLLDTLFNIASYTYGPLLGIFAFGLFTRYQIHDKWVPTIALISPICCLLLQWITHNALGYELLLLNGFITFVGLLVIKKS